MLLALMAASGALLLVACVNVANLMLSRAAKRKPEIALRRSLGASHCRILAQFLVENTLLALVGGSLGLIGAAGLIHWLRKGLPGRLAGTPMYLDWPVLWFALGVSICTGIVFGSIPAMNLRRLDLNACLKRGNTRVGGTSGARVRGAFISIQVVVSMVLLVGASLLTESLWNLIRLPLGFRPEQVLTFQISLPENENPSEIRNFYSKLRRGIESLPGVSAAGEVSALQP